MSNDTEYLKEIEARLASGALTRELRHRFELAEGRGIVGWQKPLDSPSLLIWDVIPKTETIAIADRMAAALGAGEMFFELYEVAFGGAGEWFITWVLEKAVEWAAGRGLDALFKTIRDTPFLNASAELSASVDVRQQDGKLYIRILNVRDIREVTVKIVGHPTTTRSITDSDVAQLRKMIEDTGNTAYIYSHQGKKFIPGSCGSKRISMWA